MAQLSSGSSEGIVAAGAVHAVSFNLPAAVENSKTDANDKMDENHETMEICPVGEEQDAEEPQLVSNVVPDLTSGSGSASASVAASVPAVVLASGSRPAGSMPALRGSGSGFRVSKALRSRGLAVPRRGCRVAHRRRKLFRRPERGKSSTSGDIFVHLKPLTLNLAHRYDPESEFFFLLIISLSLKFTMFHHHISLRYS